MVQRELDARAGEGVYLAPRALPDGHQIALAAWTHLQYLDQFKEGAIQAFFRTYLGVITTVLLLVTAQVVRRSLGDWYGVALLVVPGLIPMWVLFSYTAWGDTAAGLLIVLILVMLVRLAKALHEGRAWGIGTAIGFAMLPNDQATADLVVSKNLDAAEVSKALDHYYDMPVVQVAARFPFDRSTTTMPRESGTFTKICEPRGAS